MRPAILFAIRLGGIATHHECAGVGAVFEVGKGIRSTGWVAPQCAQGMGNECSGGRGLATRTRGEGGRCVHLEGESSHRE